MLWTTSTFAHRSPVACTGSGLGINLFTNVASANIGDVISYTVEIFNGLSGGTIVCDASDIQASLVTPDGVNHSLTLTRTALSSGESDLYSDVVTYSARVQDITATGTLAATASDTGTIHQNVTDSSGGGNQGLNVFVLNTLRVIKQVVNTGGGTAVASDFSMHVKESGTDVSSSPAGGVGAPGTLYSLIAGSYTVSEDTNSSYAQSFSGDCDASGVVTLLGSDDKICTITNTYIPPGTLTVVKTVVNDNGGTKIVADFPLFVNGTPVASGVATTLPPLTYAVTETIDINYSQTFSGDCDLIGHVILSSGDNKTCTITNNDIPPLAASINLVKVVVNDNSGVRTISNFPLFVNGVAVASGVTNIFPPSPVNTVTETPDANYTSAFSGDCDASGNVTLVPGDHKFCIITNDDIFRGGGGGGSRTPPLIDLVKIPSPLALSDGPGLVTYTYTLTNIGKVSVSDITMLGDTCSPIVLESGDLDGDENLDIRETWVFKCSTTLTNTHTNTVTATGWANGISAVDVASATVIVGGPGFPDTGGVAPIIHVTKVPNPLALSPGGGLVTYANIVTNPGQVALSNVRLSDDKCSPVTYVSGDMDGDSRLDTDEAWAYICSMNLNQTTTNIVVAEGEANGMRARDFAIVTVVVATPGLPNTGIALDEKSRSLWGIIIPSVILVVLFLSYQAQRKKHASIPSDGNNSSTQ